MWTNIRLTATIITRSARTLPFLSDAASQSQQTARHTLPEEGDSARLSKT